MICYKDPWEEKWMIFTACIFLNLLDFMICKMADIRLYTCKYDTCKYDMWNIGNYVLVPTNVLSSTCNFKPFIIIF